MQSGKYTYIDPNQFPTWIVNHFGGSMDKVSFVVLNRDSPAFPALATYCGPCMNQSFQFTRAKNPDEDDEEESNDIPPQWDAVVGHGLHRMKFRGHTLWVALYKEGKPVGTLHGASQFDTGAVLCETFGVNGASTPRCATPLPAGSSSSSSLGKRPNSRPSSRSSNTPTLPSLSGSTSVLQNNSMDDSQSGSHKKKKKRDKNKAITNSMELLKDFLMTAVMQYEKSKPGFTKVFVADDESYWSLLGSKPARPLESVVLPHVAKKRCLNELEEFYSPSTKEWYHKHGISYRRSILLYGPPGSGKTSFVFALAGHFKKNVCLLQPAQQKMTDNALASLLQVAPQGAFIVLEDVDALFTNHRESLHSGQLTFSGFLNALDGLCTPEGHVFFLTTNYLDRLDSALTRDGRVDVRVEIGYASPQQLEKIFLLFYPGEQDAATAFVKKLKGKKLSMSAVQNHFIRNRKSTAEETVASCGDINVAQNTDTPSSTFYT
eukprot:TRINITY_DN68107_c8_g2_i1.p1 TRINITY_DN68107_c8_g2~~TRINITY_DN68107_c8_g2_i1.p1  ORF type:complete len:510 (-),score=29.61 TRINITY_DN68107_c8_g2_i1:1371-2840(-)